jgi:hypothetical protein
VTIVKVRKTTAFTVIANGPLNDRRLSWGARGLLAHLLAKPNDWEVRVADLIDNGPAGRDAVYALLRELGERGYLEKHQTRDGETGKMGVVSYTIHEIPVGDEEAAREEVERHLGPPPGTKATSLRVEDLAALIKAYPKHRTIHGSPQALALAMAWNECVAANEAPPLATILDDLERRKRGYDWTKEEGRYVPSVKTYVERRMWTFPIHPDPNRAANAGGIGELVL